MDTYSAILLVAMTSAAVAIVGATATRLGGKETTLTRPVRAAAVLGGALALVATIFHWLSGHAPGTQDAMTAGTSSRAPRAYRDDPRRWCEPLAHAKADKRGRGLTGATRPIAADIPDRYPGSIYPTANPSRT